MMWIGLGLMIASETLTLRQVEPFWGWNTPICWTGFILFADAIVFRARGASWLRSAPREFAALAALSIPLWIVFEGFNQIIDNWYYTGLPENTALRYFGYGWSFATIWPAIFEGADLVAVLRGRAPTTQSDADLPERTGPMSSAGAALSMGAGALMLASPFLASPAIARYLAAPVWLGFIFLLDPINARLGGPSLLADWRAGRIDRIVNLALSGALCGVLWEFWNFWSSAKWHYTVPIMEHWKIFEMPLPGYFGFPPFAFECFAMYVFVRLVFLRYRPVRARRLKPVAG